MAPKAQSHPQHYAYPYRTCLAYSLNSWKQVFISISIKIIKSIKKTKNVVYSITTKNVSMIIFYMPITLLPIMLITTILVLAFSENSSGKQVN